MLYIPVYIRTLVLQPVYAEKLVEISKNYTNISFSQGIFIIYIEDWTESSLYNLYIISSITGLVKFIANLKS